MRRSAISLLLAATAVLSAAELVADGGFDQAGVGPWRTYKEVTINHFADLGRSAPGALHVVSAGGGNANVKLERGIAGKTLQITGWVRRDVAVQVRPFTLLFLDGKPDAFTTIGEIGPTGTWERFDKRLEVPANASFLLVGLDIQGTGSTWLDDVSVTVVE